LRWDKEPKIEIFKDENGYEQKKESTVFDSTSLLIPRRTIDKDKDDLWTTFNIVQENMKKGFETRTNKGYHKIRAISSINEDTRINKSLWMLADKMTMLKNN
jgi:hypothetical protein